MHRKIAIDLKYSTNKKKFNLYIRCQRWHRVQARFFFRFARAVIELTNSEKETNREKKVKERDGKRKGKPKKDVVEKNSWKFVLIMLRPSNKCVALYFLEKCPTSIQLIGLYHNKTKEMD